MKRIRLVGIYSVAQADYGSHDKWIQPGMFE